MAVLPVLRSPMINSRWPRPMGVIESMALMPVCSGYVDRLPAGHAGGVRLDEPPFGRHHGPAAVERIAQRVEHAAEHRLAHGHGEQAAGAADLVALLDREEIADDDDADGVFLQVKGQAEDVVRETPPFRRT